MKRTLLICILFSGSLFAQNVNIPDANFKAILLANTSINSNLDTEIQVSEAVAYTGTITCINQNISDLTGIEAFTNLTILYCAQNQLTSLDVSNNTNLLELGCANNQLTSLNVSNCSVLYDLHCPYNQLTSIDLSTNTSLSYLNCSDNQLTSLNVSNNTSLVNLICGNNNLIVLNVSNNTALTELSCPNAYLWGTLYVSDLTNLADFDCRNNYISAVNIANGNNAGLSSFWATGNSNLTCIQVDDVTYSTTNWTGSNFLFDNGVNFDLNCVGSAGINEVSQENQLQLYPNPSSSSITVDLNQAKPIRIEDLSGKVMLEVIGSSNYKIDISYLTPGVYFIRADEGQTVKFIKE